MQPLPRLPFNAPCRKTWLALFLVCSLAAALSLAAPRVRAQGVEASGAATAQVIVYFDDEASLAATSGVRRVGAATGLARAFLGRSAGAGQSSLADWARRPGVRKVEVDAPGHFAELDEVAVPNDPAYGQQWWLEAIHIRRLWSQARGEGVSVALLDSGVDGSHPDLQGQLVSGWNFGDGNGDVSDLLGHGTAVTGTVVARCNNGVDGCGAAPGATALPIRLAATGSTTFLSSALAEGIRYAIARGAQIINLSLTVDSETELVRSAVQEALDAGILVVVAAGNNSGAVAFPASMPGVVAVASTTPAGGLSSYTNWGPEVTVTAPGDGLVTTRRGGGTTALSGTSLSAGVVSGALATLLSLDPGRQPRLAGNAALSPLPATVSRDGVARPALLTDLAGYPLLPGLQVGLTADGSAWSVTAALPPVSQGRDFYLAVQTPAGWQVVGPQGGLHSLSEGAPVPLGRWNQPQGASLQLLGQGGALPALPVAGWRPGAYRWLGVLVDPLAGRVTGQTGEAAFTLP